MESVTWVCEDALEEHERVSPLTISMKEGSWITTSAFLVWYNGDFSGVLLPQN